MNLNQLEALAVAAYGRMPADLGRIALARETLKLIALVRLQHEALRSCGSGGMKGTHHYAQWFSEDEVEEAKSAYEAFDEFEKGEVK